MGIVLIRYSCIWPGNTICMVTVLITILLIVVAAFFNAVMDIVENENFSNSRFANCNPKFWYKRESWKWAVRIGGYKIDAWHLAKSIMLILIFARPSRPPVVNYWVDIAIVGVIWIVSFNTFYKLLKKR